MAKKKKQTQSDAALLINFKGVDPEIKRGTGRVRIPEGDYIVKILDHDYQREDGDSDGKIMGIRWTCQIVQGKHKGKRLKGYTSLKPEALWSLRNLINAALGKNVAGKALKLDPTKLYGKIVGAAVEDNEYTKDGTKKITSQINTFFPKDEAEGPDEEEEEDDDEVEEEDDEEEESDDEEEDEDEDLEDVEVDEL